MTDPILDEIWRVREELVQRYGGIDGYFKHLQAMDRARMRKARARQRKRAGKTARANSTVTAAAGPTQKKAGHGTGRRTKRAVTSSG
jgi:hypothetical protein